MTTWTFAIDESGRPEGAELEGEKDDRTPFVLGGPLVPCDASQADGLVRQALDQAGAFVGVKMPPHSKDLSLTQRAKLREGASRAVSRAEGLWLFVVDEPQRTADQLSKLVRYANVMASAIDAASRLVGLQRGTDIELRIAQRTLPLSRAQAEELARHGVANVEVETRYGTGFRAVMESEARSAIEAVRRELNGCLAPRPALRSVAVQSATDPRGHAGLWAADVGTNAMRALLEGREDRDGLFGEAAWVALRGADLFSVRELDRALRREPPRLHEAADALARLHRAAPGLRKALDSSWDGAMESMGPALRSRGSREIVRVATSVVAASEQILSERAGSYEGLWRALEAAWIGEGELARLIREQASDPTIRMRFARVIAECANHRGDVEATKRAAEAFDAAVGSRRSLRVLADRLLLRTLVVVQQQNRLPCQDPAERARIESEVRAATEALIAAEQDARAVLELGEDSRAPAVPPGAGEAELGRLLGIAVEPAHPDPDRGAALGTVARSYGFLGEVDTGLEWAMRARALFRDSEADLQFNGAVLARLLLEHARLGSPKRADRARARAIALEMAGVDLASTRWARPEHVRRDESLRFRIDIALRALLWVPEAREHVPMWLERLAPSGQDSLLGVLDQNRTHPTELVARHAAELYRREGHAEPARLWFELAANCAAAAPADSTLARLAGLTSRMHRGEPWSEEEAGFEYR